LRQNRVTCIVWHGQLSQDERDGVLKWQQKQQPQRQKPQRQKPQRQQPIVILATDIAARGIHNEDVSYVIHYDFCSNLEQYIHRCGRIRRAAGGTSYGFFLRKFKSLAPDLVALLRASNSSRQEDKEVAIDPNLLAMAEAAVDVDRPKKRKKLLPAVAASGRGRENAATLEYDNDDADDDPFPELSGQRMVLKRNENVSEPSSSSSDNEDNDDEDADR
jgi:superfamily II DNA/RNA helicase